MNRYWTIVLLSLAAFAACKTDNSQSIKEDAIVQNDTKDTQAEPAFGGSGRMNVLEVEVDIPAKENWKLIREINLPGIMPSGVGYFMDLVFVSDTTQKIVLKKSLVDNDLDTILEASQVVHINERKAKLLLPIFNKDSVFVYRGESRSMYKFQIKEPIAEPTAFDGFTVENYYIVDQGNNRILRNKGGQYSFFGLYGKGKGEFVRPSCVRVVGNKVHVSDTGNRRMQIFSMEGDFESIYGVDDNLLNPTGIASDGKHVFVCDPDVGAIFVYTNFGNLIYRIKEGIEKPIDLFFRDGKLYVTDMKGATVKILSNSFYEKS